MSARQGYKLQGDIPFKVSHLYCCNIALCITTYELTSSVVYECWRYLTLYVVYHIFQVFVYTSHTLYSCDTVINSTECVHMYAECVSEYHWYHNS